MPLKTGNLNSSQKAKIKTNLDILMHDLDPNDLTDTFISKEVFDFDDVDYITGFNPNTQRNRSKAFFDLLFQCPPEAYDVFVLALKTNGYIHLVDILEKTDAQTEDVEEYGVSKGGNHWIHSVPEEVRTRRLKEKELSMLSKTLGGNWELVLVQLGLSTQDIDQSKSAHGGISESMQIYEALTKWKNRFGNEATLEKFVIASCNLEFVSVNWDMIETIAVQMIHS